MGMPIQEICSTRAVHCREGLLLYSTQKLVHVFVCCIVATLRDSVAAASLRRSVSDVHSPAAVKLSSWDPLTYDIIHKHVCCNCRSM